VGAAFTIVAFTMLVFARGEARPASIHAFAHVPASSLLVEGDLTTQNWDYQWWGGSYMDNIDYRKIKVVTNLAVHAQQPVPIAEILSAIEKQVRGAQELCARAEAAQFFQPGCPVQYTRKLSATN